MSSINLKRLEEQVVVVFGASSGIGRLTAAKFAARGARVVIAARGEDGLVSLKEEIEASGGRCDYKVADAEDFDTVKAVSDYAFELYGALDTWVHVA
ncbi:MAG: SDR family NAD(P)-dependent oxidoreductase, partial [Candidatus Obscuribacter sp.]|nr:SDR family NAD(P)-dependent oxidoreductase [Candidatus Obscuribacter sp.]